MRSRTRKTFKTKSAAAITANETRATVQRSEEHTSELQSRLHLVCRLLLEKKKNDRSRSRTEAEPDEARADSVDNPDRDKACRQDDSHLVDKHALSSGDDTEHDHARQEAA